MIPVRHNGLPTVIRVFDEPGPAVSGQICPACDRRMFENVALVHIGPGDDPEDQQKAREGRWHTAAAVAVHALCAGAES